MGIEPTRPAWKAGILAIELHPHLNKKYIITFFIISQEFFLKKMILYFIKNVFFLDLYYFITENTENKNIKK